MQREKNDCIVKKCLLPLKRYATCILKMLLCSRKSVQTMYIIEDVHHVCGKYPRLVEKCFTCLLIMYVLY